jgi:hypothetical protein
VKISHKNHCNIPHRKSQGILRQLVPNLAGYVLEPVGCQEQNREVWKPSWVDHSGQYFARGSGSDLTIMA